MAEQNNDTKPVVTVTFYNFEVLQEMNNLCTELNLTWDYFVNQAVSKFINDVNQIRDLWVVGKSQNK